MRYPRDIPSRPALVSVCTTPLVARSTRTRSPKSGCTAKKSRKPTVSRRPTNPGDAADLVGPSRPALDLTNHRDDLAEHGRLITGDGIECRVVRHQPYLTARALERLDRGLTVEHGGDDVTVVGDILLPHHDPVTVADRGFDHRVADH